jgi:hypothetical protein
MVAADRGTNLDRESVRVSPQRGLTRHLGGNAMSAKTTPQKAKPKKSKTSPPPTYAASTISMATQNLINMVVVFAVSGTILLGLLAAKHF